MIGVERTVVIRSANPGRSFRQESVGVERTVFEVERMVSDGQHVVCIEMDPSLQLLSEDEATGLLRGLAEVLDYELGARREC